MLSILPAAIAIKHRMYNATSADDSHGNPVGALSEPVDRQVIGIYRLKWSDSEKDRVSLDFLSRTVVDVIMLVPGSDVSLYKKLDQVLIFDGAQWLAHEVQNPPISWSSGFTWQRYAKLLAGEVHIRRVQ
jgi:hypothetical protein